MTSQASHLADIMSSKPSEFVLTSIYCILTLPHLPINDTTLKTICHVMGIIRVNSFSIVRDRQVVGTGLYYPTNFINHDCGTCTNVQPITDDIVQELKATRDIAKGDQLLFSYLPNDPE